MDNKSNSLLNADPRGGKLEPPPSSSPHPPLRTKFSLISCGPGSAPAINKAGLNFIILNLRLLIVLHNAGILIILYFYPFSIFVLRITANVHFLLLIFLHVKNNLWHEQVHYGQ